ncbi:MAG: restriction endonuclease subunit S [Clostridium sp.]|nr:restriction endonuclease subunit S [Clostridium sp.]
MSIRFGNLVIAQEKSKIKAGEGKKEGVYKFFTSSNIQTKYVDFFQYDKPALIFGTGGIPSVHYCDEPFSTSTDCIVFYSNRKDYALKSLYLFFESHMQLLEDGFHGAGLQHISKKYILDIQVPDISIDKQTTINSIGDRLNKLIAIKKQQLKNYDNLVKSRFIEMFGDPVSNSMKWSKQKLLYHLNVVGGYAFKSELFTEIGIPILRIGNINSGCFQPNNLVFWKYDESLSRYMMYAGDLVMSLTGTVGKDDYGNVCILGNDYDCYYLNQRNAKLKLYQTINKHYLSQVLKFSAIKKKLTGISRGVRQANISNKDILNLEIPIPPIDIQNKFSNYVYQVDKSKFESLITINLLNSLNFFKHFQS